MKKLIILGSSRKNGDTKKIANKLMCISDWNCIDLADFNFSYYDYEHRNKNDDYSVLIHNILDTYDVLIFATPVYWYAMSGIMKVFFDRITDLLDVDKETGRKFRSKSMAVITSSIGNNLCDDFWKPFKESADYLGMNYLGNIHTLPDQVSAEDLQNFVTFINTQAVLKAN